MADRPKNYTTVIAAKRTAQECVDLLAEAGADHVAVSYADKQPVAIGFVLETPHGSRSFKMPVNIDGVAAMLAKMLKNNPPHVSAAELRRLRTREHAANASCRW